jgi:hypothetical protein
LLAESTDPRERAIVALMAFRACDGSEVVARHGRLRAGVHGKGGLEAIVLLPEVTRAILADYLA